MRIFGYSTTATNVHRTLTILLHYEEIVYSAAENIVSKKHSSLLPENVNSLIFLNKNI